MIRKFVIFFIYVMTKFKVDNVCIYVLKEFEVKVFGLGFMLFNCYIELKKKIVVIIFK